MKAIRQPAVAGTFYPSDPGKLRQAVQGYLDTAVSYPTPRPPKAIIAPHAGYVYSGPVAGSALRPLKEQPAAISRILLIGPAHTMPVRGLASVGVAAFRTPLGDVPVDETAVAALRPLPQVSRLDAAHTREHCLEVMLPFLQILLAQFVIVPLVVGQASDEEVVQVLATLWGGPETLVLVSSDLSHYYDADTARRRDMATAQAIQSLSPQELGPESACGRIPIRGLLRQAQRTGLQAHTVDLRHSGDTAGPKDRVVGYGAFIFT